MRLHTGIDVGGGKHDRTAIVVTEHLRSAKDSPIGRQEHESRVVHIERMAAMTPLDVATDHIIALAAKPEMAGAVYLLDATGIGAALAQLLRRERGRGRFGARMYAYALTAGRQSGPGSVPKQRVVNAIVERYNMGLLGFAAGLPLTDQMVKELVAFEPVVGENGRISYGNNTSLSAFDDLVIALGLSLLHPRHGPEPRYRGRNGQVYDSFAVASDPY